MNLSISRSKWLGLAFLVSFLLAWPLVWGYTVYVDPEIRFLREAYDSKLEGLGAIRARGEPAVFFVGGSASGFQIDAALLKREFAINAVNWGFHAGMGVEGPISLVAPLLQEGDSLVVMTEPPLLAETKDDLTPLACKMWLAMPGGDVGLLPAEAKGLFNSRMLARCRPGFDHVATMTGKWLMGRPMYRYSADEIEEGMMTTPLRLSVPAQRSVAPYPFSESKRRFFSNLKEWAQTRGVSVFYLAPVGYVSAEVLEAQRQKNRVLFEEIGEMIPVLEDRYLGASAETNWFADTALHLTQEAAYERTKEIGERFGDRLRHRAPAP